MKRIPVPSIDSKIPAVKSKTLIVYHLSKEYERCSKVRPWLLRLTMVAPSCLCRAMSQSILQEFTPTSSSQ